MTGKPAAATGSPGKARAIIATATVTAANRNCRNIAFLRIIDFLCPEMKR